MKKSVFTTEMIVKIAVLGALAAVLLLFNFPVPFAPSFYKVDFADIPALIGGFAFGPLAALMICLVKIVINIIIEGGSTTAFVGELSNFVISVAFTVTCAAIYRRNKTRKNALIAMLIGSLAMCFVGSVMNYFAIIPAYVYFMNFPLEAIIGMGTRIFPIISSKLLLVIFCTAPFNLFKAFLQSLLTFFLYKRLSVYLKPVK